VDDVGADLRMQPQLAALVVGEAVAFGEDVLRHGEHADVVQHRAGGDGLDLVVAQAAGAGQERGVALQPAQVESRALVGGVDGQRQRLDGREVQVGQPLHGVLLLIHPLDVGPVGAVAEAEGEHAERRQPIGRAIDGGDRQRRGGGAEDVRDPAAQQVPHPQAQERLLAGRGQRPGDDSGVDDVVRRRGHAERHRVGAHVPRPVVPGDDPEGEGSGRHRDGQGRHVEHGAVPGIAGAERVEGGLAPRRDHGDQRRAGRIEKHQRREIRREGQRHRQRLGVERCRNRHRHLEDRGEHGKQEQRPERRRVRDAEPGHGGRRQPCAGGHDGHDIDSGGKGEQLHQASGVHAARREGPGSRNRHGGREGETPPDAVARRGGGVRTAATRRCYSEQSLRNGRKRPDAEQ
jgi:hypothetical protein